MPPCSKYAEKTREECREYRDNGYEECGERRDQGYSACSSWVKWLRWICLGWTWVSNLVCVFWYWVTNVVCVVYSYVRELVCVAWDAVTTILGAIVVTLESTLGWLFSGVAWIFRILFSIPGLGRLLRWIWNAYLTVWWGLVGLVDMVLSILGLRPEKKLRVCTILLTDRVGSARTVAEIGTVVAGLQEAIDIFREEANVRILPVASFHYTSGFGSEERAGEHWVRIPEAEADVPREVSCEGWGFLQDLGTAGLAFEASAARHCFHGNLRSVVGYGAPIAVFIVEKFTNPETSTGCSQGPLTDYVYVAAQRLDTNGTREPNPNLPIAHELGHACSLLHSSDPNNLMYHGTPGTSLSWWQITLLRNSRHVSYL